MDKRLMSPEPDRKLVFADGTEYYGYGFGCDCDRVCEVVFNTSPVGYQEIISDPSYTYQAVVMTYPLIGNYGIADEDFETKIPTVGGLIVREYNDSPSNFRCTKTLSEVMEEYKIPGISGIDTRKLTRSIRDRGTRRALITSASTPVGEALEVLEAVKAPRDAVSRVSCRKRWYARTSRCGLQRRCGRFRNKAEHNPLAQSPGVQRDGGAVRHSGRRDNKNASRRCVSVKRSRRPAGCSGSGGADKYA